MMRVFLSNRRVLIGGGAVLALVVLLAILLIVHASQGSGATAALDLRLQRAANTALPRLNHPRQTLPITDTTLRSFQAWVYDSQPILAALVRSQHGNIWEQLQMTDPSTLPPQSPVVNVPGHPAVAVDPGSVTQAIKTGRGRYATAHIGNTTLRVYVVSLSVPAALVPAQCSGVLEVIAPET